jgi:hypothetical protein
MPARIASTLDGAYIHGSFTKTLGGTSFPESVWIEDFSGNALSMPGVQPLLGRVFGEADAPIGSEPQRVAVLTYRFWQHRFAGRPDAIGQTLHLDGQPFTVIGVVPRDFTADATDFVVPLQLPPASDEMGPVTVRLKPGVPMAQAEAELQKVYEHFKRTRPAAYPPSFHVQLSRLVDEERGAAYVPVLGLLFGAAALLLACYTITRRTREFGIRIALGAAPRAVLRSALQSTMLAVFAGLGAGLVLSIGLSSVLARWSIRNVDDPVVLVAAVGTLLLSTAIATLIPARTATAIDPTIALRVE